MSGPQTGKAAPAGDPARHFGTPGEILILTGPPGSGKTTAARALAAAARRPAVHLHADDFWHFIRQGAIEPYLPEAHRQNAVVMEVIARAAATYAAGGYFVVVDGIIGPWFVDPFRSLEPAVRYVVLRPRLEDAIERCRLRGGDTLSDPRTIAALHRQFAQLGGLERHTVDVTDHGPRDTLAAIAAALADTRFLLKEDDSAQRR